MNYHTRFLNPFLELLGQWYLFDRSLDDRWLSESVEIPSNFYERIEALKADLHEFLKRPPQIELNLARILYEMWTLLKRFTLPSITTKNIDIVDITNFQADYEDYLRYFSVRIILE